MENEIKINEMLAFEESISKVTVSDVIIDEKTDEYETFSKINSTGLSLSCYDLIKNYLFKEISDGIDDGVLAKTVDEYLDIFHSNLKFLENDSEKKKFFRYYIAYDKCDLVNNSDKTIYKEFKNQCCKDLDINGFEDLLFKICEFSAYYKYIKDKE